MNEQGRHRPGVGDVAREVRKVADAVEHRGIGGAVEEAIEGAHLGERVERVLTERHGHDHHEPTDDEHEVDHQGAASPPYTSDRHPASTAPSSPRVVTRIDPTTILRDGFTASTPWSGELADVVVICCSSEKYELQNQELVRALGYTMPHFIQVPGGPASLYGLAAVSGFLTKAMGVFVEKAVDLLEIKEVILIAHQDCGAYKAGRVEVLAQLTRRLVGKGIKEAQTEHLQKAARELQSRLGHGITVHSFYGHITQAGSVKQIRFEPIAQK